MKSFLIVDDDEAMRNLYEFLIKSRYNNVHIVHALNGEEGLKEARKRDYTVIISDIDMPIMNGIEFHERLKVENPIMAKKIAYISSSFHMPCFSYIVEENCPCLAKPFDKEDFLQFISCLL